MTTSRPYDVIVIGMGAMGSATVYELASRGLRVLGLERLRHRRTTAARTHGVSRIIRLAYSEHPSYVPLLRRAYERWRELESAAGEKLLHITSAPWTRAGPRARCSAAPWQSCIEHDLPHETLSSVEIARRFPGCRFPAEWMSVYQPDGGFLMSERCIVAHVTVAIGARRRRAGPRGGAGVGRLRRHGARPDHAGLVRGGCAGHHLRRVGRAARAVARPPAVA